jgi:predicted lysophospholipase L1 biosynthesis ABC-type transport system permease subunit
MLVSDYLRLAAVKAGVIAANWEGRFGFHTFRHSLASYLVRSKTDPKTLQSLLRHSDVKTTVEQRNQEMGIRMAMGAERNAIRRHVVWQGMSLAFAGVIAGLAASFGVTRLLSNFLFGVKPWDPTVFLSAPIILGAIALLAVWVPAARASKVDPMKALRAD